MSPRGGASLPRRLAGTALPLLLAACGGDPPAAGTEALLSRTLASHRASVGAASGGTPQAGPGGMGPTGDPPAPPATRAVAIGPLAAPPDTASLLGHAPETLLRLLGEPLLRRREGDAEIWRYGAAACQLDIVLYPSGGGVRVGWAAARADGAARTTEADCLRAVSRGGRRAGA